MTPATPALIKRLHEVIARATRTSLTRPGGGPRPTMHVLREHLDEPYTGWITTRPHRPGPDSYNAIAALGWAPAAIEATRILIHWDEHTLHRSLYGNASPAHHGLVVVDATLATHTTTWRPLITPPPDDQQPGDSPVWGPPESTLNSPLPPPIATALALWRTHVTHIRAPAHTLAHLAHDGYTLHLPLDADTPPRLAE